MSNRSRVILKRQGNNPNGRERFRIVLSSNGTLISKLVERSNKDDSGIETIEDKYYIAYVDRLYNERKNKSFYLAHIEREIDKEERKNMNQALSLLNEQL